MRSQPRRPRNASTMDTTTITRPKGYGRAAYDRPDLGRTTRCRERTEASARSGADITGDQPVATDQLVLREELVTVVPRPHPDQRREPEEDQAGHDEDHPRPCRATLDPDQRQDERRNDEPKVVRDVVERERAASEIVGHRLLRDRVRRDLPEEEREEPAEQQQREPERRDHRAEDERRRAHDHH